MSRCTSTPLVMLLGLFVAIIAHGAEDAHGAHDCSSISVDAERLACYDKAFGAPTGDPIAADARDQPEIREAPREFGLSDAAIRARDPEAARASSPESIEALVVKVSRNPLGAFIVTLDNGQVWMQSEAIAQGRLSAGDAVTIRKAALGSYQLVTPSKVAIRVRRVR